MNQLALYNKNFDVSLSLTPTTTLTGTTTGTTSNAVVTLKNLKVRTTVENDYYVINAACPDANSAFSTSLYIEHLPASSISVYSPEVD